MKTAIRNLRARRIWDSRGRPTVEVEVALAGGAIGRGIAPAGASRGVHEATDLRDGGAKLAGYDVRGAIANVDSIIAPCLLDRDAADQEGIDSLIVGLDPTPNKKALGGNAAIAASMAVLQAAANAAGEPLWRYLADGDPVRLPLPEVQIFGGGAHAGRRIDIQDLMVMPVGADSFSGALEMVAEVYMAAGDIMAERGHRAGVADEGGWWPNFSTNEEAIETLLMSIERSGYTPGVEVAISLDLAASDFFRDDRYVLGVEQRKLTSAQWQQTILGWLRKYPILSIEDPFAESDFDGMAAFTGAAAADIQVIGDDFLVTNADRIAAAADSCFNAVLLKPNQVGTVTETRRALETAKALGWGCIMSARSGETEDTAIAHLAIGWNAGQLKVGSFSRSERMAKWNEVIRIEDGEWAGLVFAGAKGLVGRRKTSAKPVT